MNPVRIFRRRTTNTTWQAQLAPSDGRISSDNLSQLVEASMLWQFAQREFTAIYSSLAAILLVLIASSSIAGGIAICALLLLRCASLAYNHMLTRRLADAIAEGREYRASLRRLTLGVGVASSLWGSLTWPLAISSTIGLPGFLIAVTALLAICLQIVTTAFHRPAVVAVIAGAMLSLTPKIALIYPEAGIALPLGFAVLLIVLGSYAGQIERQARGVIALQVRNRRSALRLSALNRSLREAIDQLGWLADRDDLTGLRNRRAFEREMRNACRDGADARTWILLIDIDHFKRINDRFGHGFGDDVIVSVANCLHQWESVAESGGRISGRWGGEEFILACRLAPGQSPEMLAEDLRAEIGSLCAIDDDGAEDLVLSVSIGCAHLGGLGSFDRALSEADAALYAAKRGGRNCWRIAA